MADDIHLRLFKVGTPTGFSGFGIAGLAFSARDG
jgi:hypothetical protein